MPGKIVEHIKIGKGETKNSDKPINGNILVYLKGATVDSEMLFHECPNCNIRCNCSSQPCCCCEEDFYDDIRDGSLQQMIDIKDKPQP
jgi:hypothetical protein